MMSIFLSKLHNVFFCAFTGMFKNRKKIKILNLKIFHVSLFKIRKNGILYTRHCILPNS